MKLVTNVNVVLSALLVAAAMEGASTASVQAPKMVTGTSAMLPGYNGTVAGNATGPLNGTSNTPPPPPKPVQNMTFGITGTYADDKCGNVSALTVIPNGKNYTCKAAACASKTKTTCSSNLRGDVAAAFGPKRPFAAVLSFSDDGCTIPTDGVAVPIDGMCHAVGGKSFKAVVNGDKTVTASRFSDAKCSKGAETVGISADNADRCMNRMIMSAGNTVLGRGKPAYQFMTFYKDGKCGTADSYAIVAGPPGSCADATCSDGMSVACSTDMSKDIAKVVGNKVFLQAFAYDDDVCSNVVGGVVVPVDGKCHFVGGAFLMATLNADKTVTVASYEDAKCTGKQSPMMPLFSENNGKCMGGMALTVLNQQLGKAPKQTFTVTSYYGDAKCASQQPLIRVSVAEPGAAPCKNVTTCTSGSTTQCTDDPKKLVSTMCGSKKFVAVQSFEDPGCNGMFRDATVVPVDSGCRAADGKFLKAAMNADNTLSVGMFTDARCTISTGDFMTVGNDTANMCVGGGRMATVFNVALGKGPNKPLPPPPPRNDTGNGTMPSYLLSIVSVYGDSKCSGSPGVVMLSLAPKGKCTPNDVCTGQAKMTCADGGDGVVKAAFGTTKPFVVVETFSDDNCRDTTTATLVGLDGVCRGTGGVFYKASLTADNSTATSTSYSDSTCKNATSTVKVTKASAGKCSSKTKVSVQNANWKY